MQADSTWLDEVLGSETGTFRHDDPNGTWTAERHPEEGVVLRLTLRDADGRVHRRTVTWAAAAARPVEFPDDLPFLPDRTCDVTWEHDQDARVAAWPVHPERSATTPSADDPFSGPEDELWRVFAAVEAACLGAGWSLLGTEGRAGGEPVRAATFIRDDRVRTIAAAESPVGGVVVLTERSARSAASIAEVAGPNPSPPAG